MNSLISTLPSVFDSFNKPDDVEKALVFAAWRSVAGERLSEHAEPLSFDAERLILGVADKTWQRNLESLAPQLLFRLNGLLGKTRIDFLEFWIVPVAIRSRSGSGMERASDESIPPPELSVSARKIRDESLRSVVLKAATNCLARGK